MQPRDYFSTIRDLADRALAEFPPSVSTPVVVKAGQNLQAALDVGGAIALEANATWQGNFLLSKPTVLVGAGMGASTLAPLDRFTPTLTGVGNDATVEDLTVFNGDPIQQEAVQFGTMAATKVGDQPQRIRLTRVDVQAGAGGGKRGLSLHGSDITVDQCHVRDFRLRGYETQAVWCHNGPGPYTITDSFLEASGENILFGGEQIGIVGCVPENILIRGNTLYKPLSWRPSATSPALGTCKNSLELKNARKVLIEGNTIDGCWADGQGGSVFVFTVRNQKGDSPWAVVDDVTVRGNTARHTFDGYAFNILGNDNLHPSQQTQQILIEHNLFEDVPLGVLLGGGVAQGLTFDHNTLPRLQGTFLQLSGPLSGFTTPLWWTNNVHAKGRYGINTGVLALSAYIDPMVFADNVIEGDPYQTPGKREDNTWIAPGGLAALLDPVTYKLLQGTAGI